MFCGLDDDVFRLFEAALEDGRLLQEEATFTLDVAPWFCDTLRVPFPPDFFLSEILIQPILQSKEGARAVFVAAPKEWQSQMMFYISVSRHATEPSSVLKKGNLHRKEITIEGTFNPI